MIVEPKTSPARSGRRLLFGAGGGVRASNISPEQVRVACFRIFFGSWNPETATALDLVRGGLKKEISAEGFELRSVTRSNFGIILNLKFKS